VVTTSDGSLVEDLNSTNGIFVRGKRVRRHRFADGDVVRIGMHEITYHKIDHLATTTGALDEDDDESDEDDGVENEDVEDVEETEEERDN
jgi:pSer/pThr/pTyr-binding forkhead associated (FHA) protein